MVTASLAALPLTASAPPAAASVTIGQLAPGSSPPARCNASPVDLVQPTVTGGNTYVVPVTGTVTSWTTNAAAGAGQRLVMKIFRKVSDPATYMAVGRDPGVLTPRGTDGNTFPANIPVQPGDVLGLNDGNASFAIPNACEFAVPGETSLFREGDLPDGRSGRFAIGEPDFRLNIRAVVEPSNVFTFGDVERNKKKGTATLTVDVPNPGELALAGKGVKEQAAAGAVAAVTVTAPGPVELLVKPKRKKRKKLNETGKVKVKPKVTYTPTDGEPNTQSTKLKLKKRR